MRLVKELFSFSFLLVLAAFTNIANGQVTVQGPNCVFSGLQYQYLIKASWTGKANLQVCVTGGVLADSGNSCRNGGPLASVSVVWDSTAKTGSISITSSAGQASESITIAKPLLPGALDAADTLQRVTGTSQPTSLHVAAASGGSCSPSYIYQWQHSDDAVNWSDTLGVTGQQFGFTKGLKKTKYYRLKVTDTGSGTVGYSRIAAIQVTPSTEGQ